jgi:hypothetical protein
MKKIDCDKYEECLKNRAFDPFCYRIGPPKHQRYVEEGGFLYQRSSDCWWCLTGKTYLRQVEEKDDTKG